MNLPPKPSNSCAVLHYLFQQPHDGKINASLHKLSICWKILFGFQLKVDEIPTKTTITQYALVTRALLHIYNTQQSGKYLATPIVMNKTKDMSSDSKFLKDVIELVHTIMSKDEIKQLHKVFKRPIGGSPTYVNMYNNHKIRQSHFGCPIFTAWTKICNLAGDTNMAFKPSTLKKLPEQIRSKFEEHGLKKGKPILKNTHSKITKLQTPTKRKLIETRHEPSQPCPAKSQHRYPDAPPNGWMGLMTGTALSNFVTHMTPISGQDLQLQMVRINTSKTVMLMTASIPKNFILQTTANVTLFKTNLSTIPRIMVNAKDTSIISKHFVKTAVCLLFNPCNKDHHNQTTLTFASTTNNSSISFTLVVQLADEHKIQKKKKVAFHALCNISLSIKLLKPLMCLEKLKNVLVKCEIDDQNNYLYITFETPMSKKKQVMISYHFSAEIDNTVPKTEVLDELDDVSLFVVNKQNMYAGKIAPTKPQTMISLKAYNLAKAGNSLRCIFMETYKLGLLKAITKKIPCDQKINIVMTKERMLLMSIHEYRGSIQVAQLPNAKDT